MILCGHRCDLQCNNGFRYLWNLESVALFPGLTEDFNEVATIVGLLGIQVIANLITALRLRVETLVRKCLGYWN